MTPGSVQAYPDPHRLVTWAPYTHKLPAWRLEDPLFWIVLTMIFVSLMFDRILRNIVTKKWQQLPLDTDGRGA